MQGSQDKRKSRVHICFVDMKYLCNHRIYYSKIFSLFSKIMNVICRLKFPSLLLDVYEKSLICFFFLWTERKMSQCNGIPTGVSLFRNNRKFGLNNSFSLCLKFFFIGSAVCRPLSYIIILCAHIIFCIYFYTTLHTKYYKKKLKSSVWCNLNLMFPILCNPATHTNPLTYPHIMLIYSTLY